MRTLIRVLILQFVRGSKQTLLVTFEQGFQVFIAGLRETIGGRIGDAALLNAHVDDLRSEVGQGQVAEHLDHQKREHQGQSRLVLQEVTRYSHGRPSSPEKQPKNAGS